MKKLLILLLLIPLSFAAWQQVAGLAIITSVSLLAALYMVGTGFGINELQILAKEEFFQLIAVGLLVVVLVGTDNLLNGISTIDTFAGSHDTMQENALEIVTTSRSNLSSIFRSLQDTDMQASLAGSRTTQCSIMGMGYSATGCGGFSMLGTPLSMAGGIVGFSIAELSGMEKLIVISQRYALTLLLPLGILLRTLKVTRGAGGLLIALGVSMHIMIPAGIVFNEMLASSFFEYDDPEIAAMASEYEPHAASGVEMECNAADTGQDNVDEAVDAYNSMRGRIRGYLYYALMLGTLGPVISLLMMVGSIRALSAIAGAEVDVSAISRFM